MSLLIENLKRFKASDSINAEQMAEYLKTHFQLHPEEFQSESVSETKPRGKRGRKKEQEPTPENQTAESES